VLTAVRIRRNFTVEPTATHGIFRGSDRDSYPVPAAGDQRSDELALCSSVP